MVETTKQNKQNKDVNFYPKTKPIERDGQQAEGKLTMLSIKF